MRCVVVKACFLAASYNRDVAAGGCECNDSFFNRGHNGKSKSGRCLERSVGGEGWSFGIGCGVYVLDMYVVWGIFSRKSVLVLASCPIVYEGSCSHTCMRDGTERCVVGLRWM